MPPIDCIYTVRSVELHTSVCWEMIYGWASDRQTIWTRGVCGAPLLKTRIQHVRLGDGCLTDATQMNSRPCATSLAHSLLRQGNDNLDDNTSQAQEKHSTIVSDCAPALPVQPCPDGANWSKQWLNSIDTDEVGHR